MNTRQCSSVGMACLVIAAFATGCLDRELKPLNPCLVSGVSRKVQANSVDKVDLLFMVDNSNSMAQEQGSLRAQFPKLITVLTTGERMPGDPNSFSPAKDLHVGVVSSDMGIPGYDFGSCRADGGDDGVLQHAPHPDATHTCDTAYPMAYLSYNMKLTPDSSAIVKFANDFGCIAALGTGGCGFEEQLEAPFKALWPKTYMDPNGNVAKNPFMFLADNNHPDNVWGHGDGANASFLRNDVTQGLSLIAIVVVTDEEDCSVRSTEHFHKPQDYPADSPYKTEDINLRCFYNPQFSYDVKSRYLVGFQALRPNNPNLVVFAAITGVPPNTVSPDVVSKTDFSDPAQRDSFYNNILHDPQMEIAIDPLTMPGSGNGNLKVSCSRTDATGLQSTAYPPVRIVQLVSMFGENGIVQSICQDDFGPAMDAIINVIAKQLGAVCLPRPLVRKQDGMVGCNVVWELPAPGAGPATTATTCAELPFLGPVDMGRAATNAAGGQNCKVNQLAVSKVETDSMNPPAGAGWYYDNYSADLKKSCSKTQPQRVAFTADAKPPNGVTVKLECLNETQKLANTQTNLSADPQPEIGSPCGVDVNGGLSGDPACLIHLNTGLTDDTLFCNTQLNTCVRKCMSDTDCPPAWVCDSRPATLAADPMQRASCVNPTCGADTGS